ncbi:MAG: hypothetical protein ACXITV_04940 [Luteibaculaceae bacterium]
MKIRTLAGFMYLLVNSTMAYSQVKVELKSVNLVRGVGINSNLNDLAFNFTQLLPESDFENFDYTGFESSGEQTSSRVSRFSADATFTFSDSKNRSFFNTFYFSLGLAHNRIAPINQLLFRQLDRTRLDVVSSPTSGRRVNIDSLTTEQHEHQYLANLLGPQITLGFSTQFSERVQFYFGYRFMVGLSLNNRAIFNQFITWEQVETAPPVTFTTFSRERTRIAESGIISERTEIVNQAISHGFSHLLHAGTRLQMSTQHPIWSKVNLSLEAFLGLDYAYIPKAGMYENSPVLGLNFGASYLLKP